MGWETRLRTNIIYNRQTFRHEYEVRESLDETNDLIRYHEDKLKFLSAMTEPQKYCGEESPEFYVTNTLKECLDELENLYVDRFKLELLLDRWSSCHDEEGYPIHCPDKDCAAKSYIDGDFIYSKSEEHERKLGMY